MALNVLNPALVCFKTPNNVIMLTDPATVRTDGQAQIVRSTLTSVTRLTRLASVQLQTKIVLTRQEAMSVIAFCGNSARIFH